MATAEENIKKSIKEAKGRPSSAKYVAVFIMIALVAVLYFMFATTYTEDLAFISGIDSGSGTIQTGLTTPAQAENTITAFNEGFGEASGILDGIDGKLGG